MWSRVVKICNFELGKRYFVIFCFDHCIFINLTESMLNTTTSRFWYAFLKDVAGAALKSRLWLRNTGLLVIRKPLFCIIRLSAPTDQNIGSGSAKLPLGIKKISIVLCTTLSFTQCCGAATLRSQRRLRLRPNFFGSRLQAAPAPYTNIFHFDFLIREFLMQVFFGSHLPL